MTESLLMRAARSLARASLGDDVIQRIDALQIRGNEYGFDPFGFRREDIHLIAVLSHFLYRTYFRVEVTGIENVPDGRCLLVANHSGQLPFDGLSICSAVLFDRDRPRLVRAMVEKYIQTLPFLSVMFARCGQILGTPDNCRRLLQAEEVILVFPEGVKGISKPITSRYQLQPFGLGFMRLALELRAPIVPVALIGAEEQAPAFNVAPLARLMGTPAFPLMPTPPFLPIVPYPTKHRIHFGQPRTYLGDPDDDDDEIGKLVQKVRGEIQSMIQVGLKERQAVFW